jgi:hypothetical protein
MTLKLGDRFYSSRTGTIIEIVPVPEDYAGRRSSCTAWIYIKTSFASDVGKVRVLATKDLTAALIESEWKKLGRQRNLPDWF